MQVVCERERERELLGAAFVEISDSFNADMNTLRLLLTFSVVVGRLLYRCIHVYCTPFE